MDELLYQLLLSLRCSLLRKQEQANLVVFTVRASTSEKSQLPFEGKSVERMTAVFSDTHMFLCITHLSLWDVNNFVNN